jgi:hypothetical protein
MIHVQDQERKHCCALIAANNVKIHVVVNFVVLRPSMPSVIRRAFLRSLAALPFAVAPIVALPRQGFA